MITAKQRKQLEATAELLEEISEHAHAGGIRGLLTTSRCNTAAMEDDFSKGILEDPDLDG